METELRLSPVVGEILNVDTIRDSMLWMMFSCCHPRLSEPAHFAHPQHSLRQPSRGGTSRKNREVYERFCAASASMRSQTLA
jgi:hypothetical protein